MEKLFESLKAEARKNTLDRAVADSVQMPCQGRSATTTGFGALLTSFVDAYPTIHISTVSATPTRF